jgi:Ca-activated chloride channel family protein
VSFSSPLWLAALAALPVALVAQRLARRRPQPYALRFPAFDTLVAAAAADGRWRRRLPAAALLLAVAALSIALARPHVASAVTVRAGQLVLVLDHSGSMAATDVRPTRLAAAEAAADSFVDRLPAGIRVGVVGFSSAPDIVLAPTANRAAVHRAIDSQSAFGATATGDALTAAKRLLEAGGTHSGRAAIVLLSDGAANAGQSPVAVAASAWSEGIATYTVALGTANGTLQNPEPFAPPIPVPPDPQLMHRIAAAGHGSTFTAQDASGLASIYRGLGTSLSTRASTRDLTIAFAGIGLALLLGAGLASLRLHGSLP